MSTSPPPADTAASVEDPAEPPVEDLMEVYLGPVRDELLAALPTGDPGPWLYEPVGAYPRRSSKGLRPALFLATCEAFGGEVGPALGLAVAIELFHNAFLVHDDIADGSLLRRGGPTLHRQYGLGVALNAGDALAVLAHARLRRAVETLPAAVAERVLDEFETMMRRTVEGQATELGWRRDNSGGLVPEDYLEMILHKTCWYTTVHPIRVGALVGRSTAASAGREAPAADLAELTRFGFCLGAVFQIRDDLLNLLGDRSYGKEIGGDLVEGKRTLMLIHLATQSRGTDRARVEAYLRAEPEERTLAHTEAIRSLMDTYGSIEFAQQYAEGLAVQARSSFEEAFGPARTGADNHGTRTVRSMVGHMLHRNR